jgi:glycosyltransferase involved in cell wall biosynthesis
LLTKRYRFPEASTELIYNGADLTLFTPLDGSDRSAVRQAIGAEMAGEAWSDDVLISCTVARLTPQKGLLDLVEAAAEVARQIPKVRFVLAGDGEQRARLEARVAALQLQRQVLFAGSRQLTQLARWLAAADLFVLSSHNEGMPLSMIEAMAAGCPVVATAVGGIPDVVGDSKAGLIVAPKNPSALAEAITRILADGQARSAMAAAARERAVTAFDVRTCYQKTTDLYALVTAGPARPPLRVSA